MRANAQKSSAKTLFISALFNQSVPQTRARSINSAQSVLFPLLDLALLLLRGPRVSAR